MRLRTAPRTVRGLVVVMALSSAVATLLLAGAAIVVVHLELERQLDQRIELETGGLLSYYDDHGFDALAQLIESRDRRGTRSDVGYLAGVDEASRTTLYLLIDPGGRRRAGSLQAAIPPIGWSEFVRFRKADGSFGQAQAVNSRLAGGGQLIVAADRAIIRQMHGLMLRLFAAGYGVLLLLNMLAAVGFGRVVWRRLMQIETSAEAIMAGDLTRRMALDGSGGEFDRLSLVLNRMLDRMNAMLDNLRQVSGDIAHDLRTPLQRVRSRLEAAASSAGEPGIRQQLEDAVRETDDLLDLFASLLAISEIEGRSVRAKFAPVDLGAIIGEIVDLYRPTIEETGRTLTFGSAPLSVHGDPKLLQRVVANLLDNATIHTPEHAHIAIRLERVEDHAVIRFSDDGPGIPRSDHVRVFQRLTRLDPSRSRPGHGLGLSLVAAIVGAHDGIVTIEPAPVGLTIKIQLPLRPPISEEFSPA